MNQRANDREHHVCGVVEDAQREQHLARQVHGGVQVDAVEGAGPVIVVAATVLRRRARTTAPLRHTTTAVITTASVAGGTVLTLLVAAEFL